MVEPKIEKEGQIAKSGRTMGEALDEEKIKKVKSEIAKAIECEEAMCGDLTDKKAIYLIMLHILGLLK